MAFPTLWGPCWYPIISTPSAIVPLLTPDSYIFFWLEHNIESYSFMKNHFIFHKLIIVVT
jgi:hypothetical protein